MMDDGNLLLLLFWTQLRYAVTSSLFLLSILALYFNINSTKNSFFSYWPVEPSYRPTFCKHVTMVTNHGYVSCVQNSNNNELLPSVIVEF